jgi:DNA-binding beta-propeller fold protein YncE
LLRKADLHAKRVSTIAGTGKKGNGWDPLSGKETNTTVPTGVAQVRKPLSTSLSSPWALWNQDKDLYIAMAGMHQIWKMPLDESTIGPFAGNGRENIADGPLLSSTPYDDKFASFAQPSGLASDGTQLFVADSEGSTVRALPFNSQGSVETLVGLTNTLFDFGDIDGNGRNVRLQHPLGVAWSDGKLYVADTYNNKIKVIEVAQRECRSIAGTGRAGLADGEKGRDALFNEPAGISAANGRLFVADTNNHIVRIVDLDGTNRVTTLKIDGLAAPRVGK